MIEIKVRNPKYQISKIYVRYFCSSKTKTGLSVQMKEMIREINFFEKITRPLYIQKSIFEKKVQVIPRVTHIRTFLRVLKEEELKNIATLDSQYDYCKANELLQEDKNKMFYPKFETEQEDGRIIAIRMFLTTHCLISQVTEDGNLNFKFDFFILVKFQTN